MKPGSVSHPLRVAIIGSGPSGFYAAEHLLKQKDLTVEVDMFDRLPTPFGLVRGGVAPDHQKIKTVTKVYEKTAEHPGFRFYGHVEFGRDITREDIGRLYHAVIYATGAQTDRQLGVPGEDLPGSHPATEFVAWYNGHPDFRDCYFDLSQESVAVIGVGNVAMDVARILARSLDELHQTDIAEHALQALEKSRVRTITIIGRRGPVQAAFTNPEIKELGELQDTDVVAFPEDLELDPASEAIIGAGEDKVAAKNLEYLHEFAARTPEGRKHRIVLRFLFSPVEIIGKNRVEAIRLVRNELILDESGRLTAHPTDQFETIPVGLVFRSVGYRGVELPGVPFNHSWGTIPHHAGRVMTHVPEGERVVGDYVVGWIKRGPSGVIGTNKPDSIETVNALLEDLEAGQVLTPATPERTELEALLKERGVRWVTFDDWRRLDALEQAIGAEMGRPRVKLTTVDEMLAALGARPAAEPVGD